MSVTIRGTIATSSDLHSDGMSFAACAQAAAKVGLITALVRSRNEGCLLPYACNGAVSDHRLVDSSSVRVVDSRRLNFSGSDDGGV